MTHDHEISDLTQDLLHIRLLKGTLKRSQARVVASGTIAYRAYGPFDRLLLTESGKLGPPQIDGEPTDALGVMHEILIPWHCPDAVGLPSRRQEFPLLGLVHLKFQRTPSDLIRPERFSAKNLEACVSSLARLLPQTEGTFRLYKGLHWHELALVVFTNNLDVLFRIAMQTRLLVQEAFSSEVHHSHTTVALDQDFDLNASKMDLGKCRASIRLSCGSADAFAIQNKLQQSIHEFSKELNLSFNTFLLLPTLGSHDFIVRCQDPLDFRNVARLVDRIRDRETAFGGDGLRATETILSPPDSLNAPHQKSWVESEKPETSPQKSSQGSLLDTNLGDALRIIAGWQGHSTVEADIRSLFETADAILEDELQRPAALDLINPLLYLKSQIIRTVRPKDSSPHDTAIQTLAFQRMSQLLEYALRSRTSSVALLLPATVHPAVLHGSHALHYRVIEALSSIPCQLLGNEWPGCVLVGFGNDIQLFEGACFGTPASWFSQTDHWWALVHEVGHQKAVDHRIVEIAALKDWARSHTIPQENPLQPNRAFYEQQAEVNIPKLLRLCSEVFADLYEFRLAWDNDWQSYLKRVIPFFQAQAAPERLASEFLLRDLCVNASAGGMGYAGQLTRSIGEVLRQWETTDFDLSPFKSRLPVMAANFQPAYQLLVEHLDNILRNEHLDVAPKPGTPVSMLKQIACLPGWRMSQEPITGSMQAKLIWKMSEWYRGHRTLLKPEVVDKLATMV